jgi:hypothetical protein
MAFNPTLATFSVFIFTIGMILTYLTSSKHAKLPNTCVSKQVHTGFNIILMLSIMMMIIPIVQLYCHWGCGCPQNDISYKWIIVIITFLLTISASVVLNGLKDKCDTSSVKSYMIGLIVTGVILIIVLVVLPLANPGLKNWVNSDGDSDDYYDSSVEINVPAGSNNKSNAFIAQWE